MTVDNLSEIGFGDDNIVRYWEFNHDSDRDGNLEFPPIFGEPGAGIGRITPYHSDYNETDLDADGNFEVADDRNMMVCATSIHSESNCADCLKLKLATSHSSSGR